MSRPPLSRILYVEDEADIREIVQLALSSVGGFQVEPCASGPEALEKAAGFKPDLILLDVMMPEMDGPRTLHELRQLPDTIDTPVIFMTAKVQSQDLAHYRRLGALDVILKPFDPMMLSGDIDRIWSEHHDPAG